MYDIKNRLNKFCHSHNNNKYFHYLFPLPLLKRRETINEGPSHEYYHFFSYQRKYCSSGVPLKKPARRYVCVVKWNYIYSKDGPQNENKKIYPSLEMTSILLPFFKKIIIIFLYPQPTVLTYQPSARCVWVDYVKGHTREKKYCWNTF